MLQDLLNAILINTYTQTEALSRLRALRDLILIQLFGHGVQAKSTHAQSPTSQQTTWLTSLDKNFFTQFNTDNVYHLLDGLEAEIKKIKPLVIYLPVELPDSATEDLGQHLRKNFGKNFLAEIKLDPTLIAGASLVWNGIYKDYSVKQKIADNKEKILSMLKEYINK